MPIDTDSVPPAIDDEPPEDSIDNLRVIERVFAGS